MYSVARIETAILETLAADSQLAALVRQWEVLPDLDDETIAGLLKLVPAVVVMASAGDLARDLNAAHDQSGDFVVLAFTRNLRQPGAAAHGTDTETGCWEIIEHCRRTLRSTDLGLAIIDCRPVRWQLIYSNKTGAACGLQVNVKWRHSVA
jgi:phage gp37-like protein